MTIRTADILFQFYIRKMDHNLIVRWGDEVMKPSFHRKQHFAFYVAMIFIV